MKKYILTNQNLQTYNKYQWTLNKWHKIKNNQQKLCSNGFFHLYHTPELAVLLNPIHADIKNPRLFEVQAKGEIKDNNGLKCSCKQVKLIKEIPVPEFTLNQQVAFGIYCALEVYHEKSFVQWAKNWLSGKDRSCATARAAAYAAYADAAYAYAAYVVDEPLKMLKRCVKKTLKLEN